MTVKEKRKLSFAAIFALSGVADVVAKTAGAPIDRVKLLLQNQGEMLKQGTIARPYKGIIDCTVHTFKNEGLLSFWRGILPNCIRYYPLQAFHFAFKDKIKAMFKQNKNHSYIVNLANNTCISGVAGVLSLSCVYSLDYARTRLANDVKSMKNGVGGRHFLRWHLHLSCLLFRTL